MKRLLVLLPVVAVAAACGGGDAAAPVATSEVTLAKSYVFEPEHIIVTAGTTVRWRNEDNFTHTVKLEDGPDATTHELEPGDETKVRFATAQTYRYVCTLHPDMAGTVEVT